MMLHYTPIPLHNVPISLHNWLPYKGNSQSPPTKKTKVNESYISYTNIQ